MKILKAIGGAFGFVWKNTRVWLITSVCLLVFFLTVSLIITQVTFINNTFNTIFGEERRVLVSGDPSEAQRYTFSEGIENKEDALAAANALNETICEEGFVLLKNDNGLPLAGETPKVSVFGMNSVDLVYGGSGSSARSSDTAVDLYQSLTNAGISYNETLKKIYDDAQAAGRGRGSSPSMGDIPPGFATGELPLSAYGGEISSLVGEYDDAALFVVSRIGGEGYDLPRTMKNEDGSAVTGANADDHYLELDNYEEALLAAVCGTFDNVIVIINSSASMELGFLEDDTYEGKIKAALWVGSPGGTGMNALGKILTGKVNPSGRLVDTYVRDFTTTPSYANFSTNFSELGDTYLLNGAKQEAHFVEYEEGIYVGYRYYETRGFTDGEQWYDENVVYPFGYGLSYADFTWSVGSVRIGTDKETATELTENAVISVADKDKTIFVDVTVKNNDSSIMAGKDVVQLYFTAPYIDGKVEKAHVVLGDFAKTDLLQPGDEDTVTLELRLSDTASYDYSDANTNGEKTYEADGGENAGYMLRIGRNAHDSWASDSWSFGYSLEEDFIYDTDSATGHEVENLFDDVSGHIGQYLSRSDWDDTFPTMPDPNGTETTAEIIDGLTMEAYVGSGDELDEGKKWYNATRPRQQRTELSRNETEVKLYDMIGLDYEDKLWDRLLNQLTVRQMCDLVGTGNFNTMAIDNIDKPKTIDPDGPAGFTNFMTAIDAVAVVYDTCFYAGECVVGATWNKDLAYDMGVAVGNESLAGNERDDGRPYSGWYAPAVNIHRSQFGGRNWEYYSEDGTLSGKMAARVVQGAKSKGVYTFVKHFAVNEQETHRDTNGLITWLNEQSMREIYLKPFEYTVKEGKTTAMMSSFNRLGTVWAGGSYELLTELLRDEWGFRGTVITDYATGAYMYPDQMIRAGGDLMLLQEGRPSSSGAMATSSHLQALRRATKNILYTVANSNAMNGMGPGIVYRYAMPYWKIVLILVDCLVLAGVAVWGFFAVRKALKHTRAEND